MDKEQVMEALRSVIDPEIGINIVDLGLIYNVEVKDENIHVEMTMTTPACPLNRMITMHANRALKTKLPTAKSIEVKMVWDPPWHPSMMTSAARQQLGWEK